MYGCYGYESYGSSVTESCLNLEVPGFARFNVSGGYYYYGYGYGATCEETEIEDIPPFAWAATITTCRLPDDALLCDGGVCVPPIPEGFESKWCMYQTGDLECPAGPFPVKTLFYSGVEDTRACSNCQCGTVSQSCEEAELMVFGGPDCAGEPVAYLPGNNQCVEVFGESVAADWGAEEACPVTEPSEPQGAIVAMGPFTFCCDS
jgi:hypothetical protein